MNEKRKIRSAILLIVGFIILVSGLTATYRNQTRSILQDNLDNSLQQYRDGTISEIDFATLTPFPWDRLYIFGSYTPCDGIIKALKNPMFWPTCILELGTFVDEGESLYVFTNHGFVKQYLLTNPNLSVYLYSEGLQGFTVKEARFTLSEHGYFVRSGEE